MKNLFRLVMSFSVIYFMTNWNVSFNSFQFISYITSVCYYYKIYITVVRDKSNVMISKQKKNWPGSNARNMYRMWEYNLSRCKIWDWRLCKTYWTINSIISYFLPTVLLHTSGYFRGQCETKAWRNVMFRIIRAFCTISLSLNKRSWTF